MHTNLSQYADGLTEGYSQSSHCHSDGAKRPVHEELSVHNVPTNWKIEEYIFRTYTCVSI